MNRENRRDVFEAVGMIAIIASLMFLAIEINQNTNALHGQSRQSVLEAAQSELFLLVEHPEIALSVIKDGPLTAEENVKLDAYLAATLRAREYAWLQYQDGAIDEEQWKAEGFVIRSILNADRVREWWDKIGRTGTSPKFADFVDSKIVNEPVTAGGWRDVADWANR
jgi:hypothetical protein